MIRGLILILAALMIMFSKTNDLEAFAGIFAALLAIVGVELIANSLVEDKVKDSKDKPTK